MISLDKLAKLAPRHRMRKAALVLEDLERELLRASGGSVSGLSGVGGSGPGGPCGGGPCGGGTGSAGGPGEARVRLGLYAAGLGALMAAEPELPLECRMLAEALAAAGPERLLRAIDALRHSLKAAAGLASADWDLIDPATGCPDPAGRRIRKGRAAYLEDLRSPFNVGAAFRTADAFGLEELVLSPRCADPAHPRAERSAMGAVGVVAWRRGELGWLEERRARAFALELGGVPIDEFDFPESGVVVLGSEELGVSPEALALCGLGKVSIPMSGAKGSLNAAVAFGILLHAWSRRA